MMGRKDLTPNLPLSHTLASCTSTVSSPVVLVADDHEDTRSMLRTILEMENFSVVEAMNGLVAFQVAVEERPNVILMDLVLPIVDGVTATRAIRKHPEIGGVPIIFLSGRVDPSGRKAAFEAGCNDFLIKPVDIDDVVLTVRRWLATSGAVAHAY